jgi:hypothetical protein
MKVNLPTMRPPQDDRPVSVPCWLVHAQKLLWAYWWCPKCKYWHKNGWGKGDHGNRVAHCPPGNGFLHIKLKPIGWADDHIHESIMHDRANGAWRANWRKAKRK